MKTTVISAFLTICMVALEAEAAGKSRNLIPNGGFEEGALNMPASWNKGFPNGHTAAYAYPVFGYRNGKAALVTVADYVRGDAKWYFDEVSAKAGEWYRYQVRYSANASPNFTVRFTHHDDTFSYKWLDSPPASLRWRLFFGRFQVPENVRAVTVLNALTSDGALTIDEVSLVKVASPR